MWNDPPTLHCHSSQLDSVQFPGVGTSNSHRVWKHDGEVLGFLWAPSASHDPGAASVPHWFLQAFVLQAWNLEGTRGGDEVDLNEVRMADYIQHVGTFF